MKINTSTQMTQYDEEEFSELLKELGVEINKIDIAKIQTTQATASASVENLKEKGPTAHKEKDQITEAARQHALQTTASELTNSHKKYQSKTTNDAPPASIASRRTKELKLRAAATKTAPRPGRRLVAHVFPLKIDVEADISFALFVSQSPLRAYTLTSAEARRLACSLNRVADEIDPLEISPRSSAASA